MGWKDIDTITTLDEMTHYINETYDDIVAHIDNKYHCVDVETTDRVGSEEYITCIFDENDFKKFIKEKEQE